MFSWLFGKSAEEQRNDFESKINRIATSLIKNAEQNTPDNNMDLAALLDPTKCNEYTLFLGDELNKRFKKPGPAIVTLSRNCPSAEADNPCCNVSATSLGFFLSFFLIGFIIALGQELDWYRSPLLNVFFGIAIICFTFFILHIFSPPSNHTHQIHESASPWHSYNLMLMLM